LHSPQKFQLLFALSNELDKIRWLANTRAPPKNTTLVHDEQSTSTKFVDLQTHKHPPKFTTLVRDELSTSTKFVDLQTSEHSPKYCNPCSRMSNRPCSSPCKHAGAHTPEPSPKLNSHIYLLLARLLHRRPVYSYVNWFTQDWRHHSTSSYTRIGITREERENIKVRNY
jgi:hypothetical protein